MARKGTNITIYVAEDLLNDIDKEVNKNNINRSKYFSDLAKEDLYGVSKETKESKLKESSFKSTVEQTIENYNRKRG